MRGKRSRVATEGWGTQLLALQSPAGNWGGPQEDRGLLITLYTLVVLKDLGLDPASKQARKMLDRVDRRRLFKWHNNRPFCFRSRHNPAPHNPMTVFSPRERGRSRDKHMDSAAFLSACDRSVF